MADAKGWARSLRPVNVRPESLRAVMRAALFSKRYATSRKEAFARSTGRGA
jgi:hypothetical protein